MFSFPLVIQGLEINGSSVFFYVTNPENASVVTQSKILAPYDTSFWAKLKIGCEEKKL